MPALLSERMMRRRLPTCSASACVLSSCACPSVMANSPSSAMIFGELGRADDIPERGLAGGRGDTHAGRSAVDVVGDVDGFGVAGQSLDAAQFRLREKRMIGQALILEERLHGAGAAAEPECVDGQNRVVGIGVVALVACRFIFALERLAHDHPQGVSGGNVVAARQHELVAEGMLRAPVIVTQSAQFRSGKMRRDVEGRVRQRAAEMARLGIIPQQHQGHAGHVPDVFQAFPAERHIQWFNGRQ